MKGLLRNNFYATLSNIKLFFIVMALAGVFVAAVVSQPLLLGYTVLSMVGYPFLSVASFHRENASKWSRYKLAAPIQRADIIKSYFFSQLVWIAVGMTDALFVIGLACLLHGFPFDKSMDLLNLIALGLSISLFMSAIFFPLHYIGENERNEADLFVSLLCSTLIAAGIISLINRIFGSPMTELQQLVAISILLVCSIFCFWMAIPITGFIFRRKEY